MIQNNRLVVEEPNIYHAAKGISSHALISMNKSPKTYYERYVLKKDEPPTEAMLFGTMMHMAILEPEKFSKTYFVEPKADKRTNAGKALIAEFSANLPVGALTITQDEQDIAKRCQDSFYSHKVASSLLKDGKAEMSGYATDVDLGLELKIRPDFITHDNMLIDLKTCRDASKQRFSNSLLDFGYYQQCAHYVDVFSLISSIPKNEVPFIFIALENTAPFGVAVYTTPQRMIEEGRNANREALFKYIECSQKNTWLDLNDSKAVEIDLPPWFYSRKQYKS